MASWRILGASVTGTSHHRMGRGCDDAHAYRVIGDDLILLAAADGAGSAKRSALGAATAVQQALDSAERLLSQQGEPNERERWFDMLSHIVQDVHASLLALVSQRVPSTPAAFPIGQAEQGDTSFSLRELATTLLFVAVTPRWAASLQVGDGAIVARHTDGAVVSLTAPTQQTHLDVTDFVTDDDYLQRSAYNVQPRNGIQGLALLTDGLQIIAMHFPDNTAHAPFFTPLFRFAARPDASEEELQHFLESERVCARTDDDKTLVLAVYQ